jgi:RNA polymerase sigma-70 factor (ECF subfamily)
MAGMPLVDQEIFWLCLVGDLSYKQAARQLGISHGSVRNRLSRLKARLRSELSLLKGD